MKPSKADIDPRLQTQIAEAGDQKPVEALLMLDDGSSSEASHDIGKIGKQILERVSQKLRERPLEVRLMPRLGVLFVKGSGKLINTLLQQDEVISASANEDDVSIAER